MKTEEQVAAAPAAVEQTPAQDVGASKVTDPGALDFEELERKVESGEYSPTDEEAQAYDRWEESGRPKAEKKPEQPKEEPKEEGAEVPKDLASIDEDEAERLNGLMKKFNIKSVNELPEAIKRYEDEQNAKKGALGREAHRAVELEQKMEALQRQLDMQRQQPQQADPSLITPEFLEDFRNGVPAALSYAKETLGWNVAQQASRPADDFDIPDEPPEDVVDVAAWKNSMTMIRKLKEGMGLKLREYEERIQTVAQAAEVSRQEAERIKAERESARREETLKGAVMELMSKYPETYRPKSGDPMKMLETAYRGGHVDPRLQNVIDTVKFANANGFRNLEHAHIIRNSGDMSRRIAEEKAAAMQEGRNSVLKQTPSVGLAGRRNATGESAYQPVTEERFQAILNGSEPPPATWWKEDGGSLDPDKIPVEFHAQIWPEGRPK